MNALTDVDAARAFCEALNGAGHTMAEAKIDEALGVVEAIEFKCSDGSHWAILDEGTGLTVIQDP